VTGQSGDVRLEVNRWVFRCFLKVLQCRTSGGKLFHISGAEYENARLAKFVHIVGNVSKGRTEKRVVLIAARGIILLLILLLLLQKENERQKQEEELKKQHEKVVTVDSAVVVMSS